MTDDELLDARVKRIASGEHVLRVIEKYAAKWHQLDAVPAGSSFDAGRKTGYVEVISALLGVEFGPVHEMLRSGQL